MERDLSKIFSEVSADRCVLFRTHLKNTFKSDETAGQVMSVLRALQVEIPENGEQYMRATEGALLFSNRFGVVIRIEKKEKLRSDATRINDHPFVLQPIASFEVDNAIVEICPGCHNYKNSLEEDGIGLMAEALYKSGVDFWDENTPGNIGWLPVRTPVFPDGIPVVVDRLAVGKLNADIINVKTALAVAALDEDPQAKLYAPLKQAIEAAWPAGETKPDDAKIKDFWALCAKETRKGTLQPGWNEGGDDFYKKMDARFVAKNYDHTIAQKLRQALFN